MKCINGSSSPIQKESQKMKYRRTGFNCKSLINVNCDLNLRSHLLEHSYYYAMIDSVHVTHVLTLLAATIKDEHLTLLEACYW